MADPPVEAGAVKATEALVGDEAVAEPMVGAPGATIAVAGNTAITVPLLALFVTDVAPVTVKELAETPDKVYVASGVTVIVAVSTVFGKNGLLFGFQVIVVAY